MLSQLPYHLGCTIWSHDAWPGRYFPQTTKKAVYLTEYAKVFSTVEGNNTFYGLPSEASIQRWLRAVPEHFRFCFKFPREVTHAGFPAYDQKVFRAFLSQLQPLAPRIGRLFLQFPDSAGPEILTGLRLLFEELPAEFQYAVEVRHAAFFDKGEAEKRLNRLLMAAAVDRVCFDSRALFSESAHDVAMQEAQRKKPRLPVHPLATAKSPLVRYVAHPELALNAPYLEQWVTKFAQWIEADLQPYFFAHTPDNVLAPALARMFHEQLQQRLPGLTDLAPFSFDDSPAQPDLLF